MYCNICGNPTEEGQPICPACRGLPVEPSPTPNDLPEPMPQIPKRRSKTSIIIAICMVVVIALGVTVFLSWNWIQGFYIRSFGTPQEYLVFTEQQWMKPSFSALSNAYDEVMQQTASSATQSIQGSLRFVIGESPRQYLETSLALEGLNADLDWLEEISLQYNLLYSQQATQYDIHLGLKDQHIAQMRMFMDQENQKIWYGFPELNEEYLYIDQSIGTADEIAEAQKKAKEALLEKLPDRALLDAILNDYADFLLTYIAEAEMVTETVTLNDISQELTVLSTTFTEVECIDLVMDILRKAQTDPQLRPILVAFVEYTYESQPTDYEFVMGDYGYEYVPVFEDVDGEKKLDELLEEELNYLQEERSNASEEAFLHYSVYVDNNHQICGRDITIEAEETFSLYYILLRDGKQYALQLRTQSLDITGTGCIDKQELQGAFTFTEDKEVVANVNLQLNLSGMASGQFSGSMTAENLAGNPDNSMQLPMSFDKIVLDWNLSDQECICKMQLHNDDELVFGMDMSGNVTEGSAIELPAGGVEASDLIARQNWLSAFDFQPLLDNLRQSAMSEEYVDYLEEYLQMLYVAPIY